MAKTTEMQFQPLAGRGIDVAVEGDHVYLRLSTKRDGAQPSSTGKMLISAATANGWADIPGTEGLRMNLNAGFRAAK